MKNKLKYLIFFTSLVFILFLYGFSVNRNSNKKVKDVKVEFSVGDNHFLTHQSVNKLLIQNADTVQNLLKSLVDLHRLESVVLSDLYVEKASVSLTLDGILKVLIKQREPLGRVVSNKETFYVDKYGVKIPLSANFSSRVPLITGVETVDDIKELTKVVSFISNNDFLKKEIVGIEKTKNKEYIFAVRSGNYKIEFGEFTNADIKIKKLRAFYNNAFFNEAINKYKKISVKYHNQVVCTKI